MSAPSRDGTLADEVIANAEPKECHGSADGKDRSIRRLDSKHVHHFLHPEGYELLRRRRPADRSLTR